MKKTLKKLISFTVIAALLMTALLTGCSEKTEAESNKNEAETKKDTLTVAFGADPPTLDPHSSSSSPSVNALNPIYETLVRYDDDGKIIPLLAESWEQIDELSWKFTLRKGVKFHNGEEMKASDVIYSMKRATGPDGAKVSYIMQAIDSAKCEVIDDYTVILRTHKPFAPLIGYLPYVGANIVSEKEFTTDAAKAAMNPVGTGPFKFVEWKKGDRVTYIRNDDYWGEKPAYKNLIIRTIVEANSRVIELEAGGVDIAFEIPANDVQRLEDNPDTKILRNNSTVFGFLGMNTSKEPFNNVEFRRAIDLAINEESLVQSVFRGNATYTPGPVTPNMKYFDDSDVKCKYDPEEAKKILKELGIAEGTTYEIKLSDNKERIDTATIMQSMLKEVGINLEIKVLEAGTFWDALEQGDSQFFLSGWGAVGFPEPDNNIFGPLHTVQIPANNYCYYSNPELDKLLDASRVTPDSPEREKIVKDVQKLIRSEVPYVTYANPQQVVGVRSNVQGFNPTPAASHFVHKAYFE